MLPAVAAAYQPASILQKGLTSLSLVGRSSSVKCAIVAESRRLLRDRRATTGGAVGDYVVCDGTGLCLLRRHWAMSFATALGYVFCDGTGPTHQIA